MRNDVTTLGNWMMTVGEVAFGWWLTESMPIMGGAIIGAAMGCQFIRIVNEIEQTVKPK